MSLKRSHGTSEESASKAPGSDLFESSPIDDRKSRFVGLFSPTVSPKTLQAHEPYKSASHRILAWRRPSKQQSLGSMAGKSNALAKTIYDTGSDDDGEQYAGRKLEKLLVEMNVVGAVVVARQYGGVLLGPVRFDHILNVAKEAIEKWRESTGSGSAAKKVKVDGKPALTPEQEAELKSRLVRQLSDRDSSIKVLRELLAEKKAKGQATTGDAPTSSPVASQTKVAATPNYAGMPLKTLQQLEKARDTTIKWVLKQIDESEKQITI